MSQKVICDPVHGHIYIDLVKEQLILKLLCSREIQRLRRIHQLGVSYLTYPGAEHSRFSHALGTFHLTKLALKYLGENEDRYFDDNERIAVLAAGLLHDIGHGPFSHVLEKDYGIHHEAWTEKLIVSKESEVNSILRNYNRGLPRRIIKLLFEPAKEFSLFNALLSSQLDVDRMDYLLRDSYFCGNSYGKFDYMWILHTMKIGKLKLGRSQIEQPMWTTKAVRAIEDYIFARHNMYWTVYYHPATRGYEVLLKTILDRAKFLAEKGRDVSFLSTSLKNFVIKPERMKYKDFIALDDAVLLAQVSIWRRSRNKILSDLCRRLLDRDGLKWVDFREDKSQVLNRRAREIAEAQIKVELKKKKYNPSYYLLDSVSAAKAYDYYHFERGSDLQTAKNSIFILDKDDTPTEISSRKEMQGLKAITGEQETKKFYYVPIECRRSVNKILDKM